VLVDRVWSRGLSKERADIAEWRKDVAPSKELRQWFGHDPGKWAEFKRRYFAELAARPEAWQPLLEAAQQADLTLVFSARDRKHNNAVALAEYLRRRMPKRSKRNKH